MSKKKNKVTMFRQGDVGIIRVDSQKASGKQLDPDAAGRTVLAYGEVTGHMHQVVSKKQSGVKLFDIQNSTDRLLTLEEAARVLHEEHDPVELPAGNYVVRIQRTYNRGEVRNVLD